MRVDIFPDLESAGDLRRAAVRRHEPGADGRLSSPTTTSTTSSTSTASRASSRSRFRTPALLKLTFHPGTDMAEALAQTIGYVNRARAFMPPGTVGPFIMRFDAGTRAGRLSGVLERDAQPRRDSGPGAQPRAAAVRDAARPDVAAAVRRQPAHDRHPRRSRSAARVRHVAGRSDPRGHDRQRHHAVGQREHRRPDAHLADQLGRRRTSTTCSSCRSAPAPGPTVFVRDVGSVSDSTDIPTAYALVNGRRAVYIPVTKRPDASTLTVVSEVKANLGAVPGAGARRHQGVATSSISRATCPASLQRRAARGAARRAAHRPDGAAVPARLAQRGDRRRHDSVRAADGGRRAVGAPARRSTS